MSGFLLDTNVISEYNKESAPHPNVVRWIKRTPEAQQHLSVLTLAEIEKGILRKGESKRRRELEKWFAEDLQKRFAGRILAFDSFVASRWAKLVAAALDAGRPLPTIDSQIAATALAHGLTLVTRNTKDFAGFGLKLLNQWLDE